MFKSMKLFKFNLLIIPIAGLDRQQYYGKSFTGSPTDSRLAETTTATQDYRTEEATALQSTQAP